jgi:hypothetical protein
VARLAFAIRRAEIVGVFPSREIPRLGARGRVPASLRVCLLARPRHGVWRLLLGCCLALAVAPGVWAALKIGWAEQDITPKEPVLIAGQFNFRVSEKVLDPLTATVLVLESESDQVTWVSCDLVGIANELRDGVRARLMGHAEVNPAKVILHATHSHTGPEMRATKTEIPGVPALPVMAMADVLNATADRIAAAVVRAWAARAPGGVSFGLGHAVVGRNRRSVDTAGVSTMYADVAREKFSHVEGFEDHDLNLLATYDLNGALTGVIMNLACPAQVTESIYSLSADFWHDTRVEMRRRFGPRLFVAAQCSTAGDIAPHFDYKSSYNSNAAKRMLNLKQRSVREEIAHRLANASEEVLPLIGRTVEWDPVLQHRVETLELPLNQLSESDVASAQKEAAVWRARFETEQKRIAAEPGPLTGRWYVAVSTAYSRLRWNERVQETFERLKSEPTRAEEIHVVRLGDVAFATNPFEYFLDYGIQIKAKSPATQTFLVQLAGSGTYVPSQRAASGGGYGAQPQSNPVGPEGGRMLREKTSEFIRAFWP